MAAKKETDEQIGNDIEAEVLQPASLHQQMKIVHALGASSPDFLYVFDLNQRFIFVSPPLLELWDKKMSEVLGKNFEELGYPSELVNLHRQQLDDVWQEGRFLARIPTSIMRAARASTSTRLYQCSAKMAELRASRAPRGTLRRS